MAAVAARVGVRYPPVQVVLTGLIAAAAGVVAVARLEGEKSVPYQAVAHLLWGALPVGSVASFRLGDRTGGWILAVLTATLFATEFFAFLRLP